MRKITRKPSAAAAVAKDIDGQTLYKKVRGKYIQTSDPWAYSGLREGHYLVIVRPNSTTIRQPVCPDYPELEAALVDMEEELTTLLADAGRARPTKEKLTASEQQAWDRFIRNCGENFGALRMDSYSDIARKIVEKVRNRFVK